jgi:ribosomal protein L11 methyltransferase
MFELSLMCRQSQVDALSDALEALDALSISIEDADAQTDAEQALFGEPGTPTPRQGWCRSQVSALFATQALAQDALTLLMAQDFFAGCRIAGIQAVPEQDWVRLSQSGFAPVAITPEFWIVPSWHEPPEQARIIIRLDPGLAFGTGTHPSTRMCLRWIARRESTRASMSSPGLGRVLDYGCGSGILAIAAARYGALDIDAVDIDQAAIQTTRLNARANAVHLRVGLPGEAVGRYQTVLANILATPLKALAPQLWSHVADAGSLVLSGILKNQTDELITAYAPFCQLSVTDEEDGWSLLTAQRPPLPLAT